MIEPSFRRLLFAHFYVSRNTARMPPLSYNKYLKVPELISDCRKLYPIPPSHDETLLFIIIHQTYELWFKQILHELDATISWLDEGRMFRANHSLRGVISIEKNIGNADPSSRNNGTDRFSGISRQAESGERFSVDAVSRTGIRLGCKGREDSRIHSRTTSLHSSGFRRVLTQPTLADAFWELVGRNGLAVETHEERVAATVEILTHPEKFADLYNLQDLLIEHDELIIAWRYNHIQMVERMLGMKRGTGGSEGVGYLMTTLTKKFFPELWEARTHLTVGISQ